MVLCVGRPCIIRLLAYFLQLPVQLIVRQPNYLFFRLMTSSAQNAHLGTICIVSNNVRAFILFVVHFFVLFRVVAN